MPALRFSLDLISAVGISAADFDQGSVFVDLCRWTFAVGFDLRVLSGLPKGSTVAFDFAVWLNQGLKLILKMDIPRF